MANPEWTEPDAFNDEEVRMTNKTTSAIDLVERPRFHVEGQTSTVGERWRIWDNVEGHWARFGNIAVRYDADKLCEMLNVQSDTITRLQAALRQAEENFGYLANWRDDAIGHDIDIGQEPRTFCEDVEMIEDCARRYRDRIRAIRSSVGGE